MNNRTFWTEAVKAGTVMGLAIVGITLLQNLLPAGTGTRIMGWLHWIVFLGLMFGFTRNVAAKADPAEGFNYGRCLTFGLAMMLFVGFLMGVYQAIAVNTFMHEQTLKAIDQAMELYAKWGMNGDMYYDMLSSLMFNPVYVVFVQIFGSVCSGLFCALIVGAFVQRKPNAV